MTKPITAGTILLAEPFMMDPNFKRAAVLMVEHGEGGSVGFILNREVDMRVNDLIDDFPEFDAPIYYGGPVGTDSIHYLHSKGDLLEGSDEVSPGVFWGGDYEQLKFLIESKLMAPQDVRFFVGYSGWSQFQLDEEMKLGSWVTAPMFANYLFKSGASELWKQVMTNKGDAFSVIAEMEDGPSYN